MLVILNVGYSLAEVAVIRGDSRRIKAVLDLPEELLQHWDSVLVHHDSLHLHWLNLIVPLVVPNIVHRESFNWVCVQNFLYQIFGGLGDESRNEVVAVQYLFIEFAGVGVLEGEVATSHGVEDDAAAPNIRVKSVITLPSNHLRCSIAWTSTGSFQHFPLLVRVRESEVNDFDIILVVQK